MKMGKTTHKGIKCGEEAVSAKGSGSLASRIAGLPSLLGGNLFAILFFVAVWALLAFRESALLFRINELSVFLFDNL